MSDWSSDVCSSDLVTLLYCAGNFAETLGIHRIREMDGVGRRMPWTMTAFSIGALGMIGIPPIAGFISKWTLGLGALEVGQDWVLLVLLGSALLNAAYFLPLLWRGWFAEPADWPQNRWRSGEHTSELQSLMRNPYAVFCLKKNLLLR